MKPDLDRLEPHPDWPPFNREYLRCLQLTEEGYSLVEIQPRTLDGAEAHIDTIDFAGSVMVLQPSGGHYYLTRMVGIKDAEGTLQRLKQAATVTQQ